MVVDHEISTPNELKTEQIFLVHSSGRKLIGRYLPEKLGIIKISTAIVFMQKDV